MKNFFLKKYRTLTLSILAFVGIVTFSSLQSVDAQEMLVNAFGNSPSGAFVVTASSGGYDSTSYYGFMDFYEGGGGGGSSSGGGGDSTYYYVPYVSLTAQPLSVNQGESTTLVWSASDVGECTASGGWSGAKATNGSEVTGALSSDTWYTLTCAGYDGSVVESSVFVTITSPDGGGGGGGTTPPASNPVPTVSITASPATVNYGGGTTLYWVSTDAYSCEASNAWSGTQPISGSFSIYALYSQATYTITCTGAGGSMSSSVTVNVNPNGLVDEAPVGNLDSATCSTVNGWAYDPDTSPTTTYVPPSTSSTACWQTPSAVVIDGYTRCQNSGACTAGGTADSKCLDADGNMEQPPGSDYCIAVDSLDDADCNRPVPYTPPTSNNTLSCRVIINEPANALGISNHGGEGVRVLGNQASANFACQQLGYVNASYFATKGFSSCGDNQLAYDGGGFWGYGDACVLGNAGISWVQCDGTGAICQNQCGNGVIDSGEQCDGNTSTNYNRCGDPTWYCSNSCRMISNNLDDRELCP